jgi:hypothetical protein
MEGRNLYIWNDTKHVGGFTHEFRMSSFVLDRRGSDGGSDKGIIRSVMKISHLIHGTVTTNNLNDCEQNLIENRKWKKSILSWQLWFLFYFLWGNTSIKWVGLVSRGHALHLTAYKLSHGSRKSFFFIWLKWPAYWVSLRERRHRIGLVVSHLVWVVRHR